MRNENAEGESGLGLRLTVLGTRGSVPVCGSEYAEFGGSTSCYLVEAGNHAIILDAGTGILRAPVSFPNPPAIILSHWHLDHVLGLGLYARLSKAGAKTNLYVPASSDQEGRKMLDGVYGPPYWPLVLDGYGGTLHVHAMPQELRIGSVSITSMEGNHPGGCLVLRIAYKGKSIVYATDYEHDQLSFERLAAFARGADLILYDAQYADDEYDAYCGFGHSTSGKGVELLRASGAQRGLLVHHDPTSTDEVLRRRERDLACDAVRFAREGEVILL